MAFSREHPGGLRPMTARQIAQAIMWDLQAGITPIIEGSPGIGKSAVVRMIERKADLFNYTSHLAGFEPVDINGFPDLSGDKAVYKPFSNFPVEGDTLPINPTTNKPYKGFLVFLDEMTAAKMDTQAAAYPLILDRKVGLRKLHPNTVIIAAGNLATDNAIYNPYSTALISRTSRYFMVYDHESFIEDVVEADKWPVVFAAFFEQNPDFAYNFDSEKTELSYASPRTWEFVMKKWKIWEALDARGILIDPLDASRRHIDMKNMHPIIKASVEANVGKAAATAFFTFLRTVGNVPTIQDVIQDPFGAVIPQSPGLRFLVSVILRRETNVANIASVYDYMTRFEPEHRMVWLRGLVSDNSGIHRNNPTIVTARQELRNPART